MRFEELGQLCGFKKWIQWQVDSSDPTLSNCIFSSSPRMLLLHYFE